MVANNLDSESHDKSSTFCSPRGVVANKAPPIATVIEEEIKTEELSKEDRSSIVSHPLCGVSEHTTKDLQNKINIAVTKAQEL